ncbi:Neuralized-like protein 2, partial [Ophiophagus hannah]
MAAARHPPPRFPGVHGAHVCMDASRTQATRVESFAHGLCFSHRPLEPGQIFLVEIEEKELGWCGHLRVGLTAHDPCSLAAVPEYSLPDLVNLGDSWVFAITRNHNRVSEAPAGGRGLLCGPHLLIEQVRIPRDKLVGRSRPGRYSHSLDALYKASCTKPACCRPRPARAASGCCSCRSRTGRPTCTSSSTGKTWGPAPGGCPGPGPSMPWLTSLLPPRASESSRWNTAVGLGVALLPPLKDSLTHGAGPGNASVQEQLSLCKVMYFSLGGRETLCRTAIQRHISHRLAIDGLNLPPLLKNLCKYE